MKCIICKYEKIHNPIKDIYVGDEHFTVLRSEDGKGRTIFLDACPRCEFDGIV